MSPTYNSMLWPTPYLVNEVTLNIDWYWLILTLKDDSGTCLGQMCWISIATLACKNQWIVCGYCYSSCFVCCAAQKKSRASTLRRLLLSCFGRSKSNKSSSSSRAREEFYSNVSSLPACDCCSLRGPDYVPEGKLNFPIFLVQNRFKVPLAFSHFLSLPQNLIGVENLVAVTSV